MKASDYKKMAFESISAEVKKLTSQIESAAKKGQLKTDVESLSDAAKIYLTDTGFEVKLFFTPGEEPRISKDKFTISWANAKNVI